MLVTAIILAGGQGKRMREELPKQFLPLGKKLLLAHAITPFSACPQITEIVLVVPADTIAFCREEVVKATGLVKVKKIVAGGSKRADSVYNGLLNTSKQTDYVLIHDGVRPFVTESLIQRVLTAAIEHGSAVPGLKVKETVKRSNADSFVDKTVERDCLFFIQTPQAFRFNLVHNAYQRFHQVGQEITDDSQLVEMGGYQVKVVRGEEENLKVTTPADLKLAEFYWQNRERE